MRWDDASRVLRVTPTVDNAGVYDVGVRAWPDHPQLRTLITTEVFRVYVDESCTLGYRYFRITTFTDRGLLSLNCNAQFSNFISYYEVRHMHAHSHPRLPEVMQPVIIL
jgi:hypothetical protein